MLLCGVPCETAICLVRLPAVVPKMQDEMNTCASTFMPNILCWALQWDSSMQAWWYKQIMLPGEASGDTLPTSKSPMHPHACWQGSCSHAYCQGFVWERFERSYIPTVHIHKSYIHIFTGTAAYVLSRPGCLAKGGGGDGPHTTHARGQQQLLAGLLCL